MSEVDKIYLLKYKNESEIENGKIYKLIIIESSEESARFSAYNRTDSDIWENPERIECFELGTSNNNFKGIISTSRFLLEKIGNKGSE